MTKKESKILQTLALTDDALDKVVKIQGTKYDRKRKVSEATLKKMLSMSKNKSYQEIARKLDMSPITVRYNIDPVWRAQYNQKRDGKHTGKKNISILDRVAYKRSLVAAGKITV